MEERTSYRLLDWIAMTINEAEQYMDELEERIKEGDLDFEGGDRSWMVDAFDDLSYRIQHILDQD